MFSRVLPPSVFALPPCSQSAEYRLTVSRFIAATRRLRVSQLHVSIGTSQEAGWKHRWAQYGSSTICPGRGLVLARWPPASSETQLFCKDIEAERNQSQTTSSVRLCKANGLSWLLPFGGGLAVSAGRSSPCPFPLMAELALSERVLGCVGISHKGRALLLLTSGSLTHKVPRDIKQMEKVRRKHKERRSFLLTLLKGAEETVPPSLCCPQKDPG